ncbi:MAG TPA: EamA family transporter [Bacteroidia bacterium]|nr:EamA family transporter [Bacteroidia bacterium]
MNRVVKAHLALLIVNFIYGANFTIVKSVQEAHIPPFALVLLRAFSSMTLFWLTSFFVAHEKIERKDFIKVMMLGVFGVALNQLLFIKGLYQTTPINASIIMMFNPAIVMLIEIIFLNAKALPMRVAGIVMGIFGTSVLLLFGNAISAHTGDVMVLINCISWGIYLVMVKPLMIKYKTVTIVKWVFAFGTIYVLPFGWPEARIFDPSHVSIVSWICIGYVVVASTYIAYFLNTYALAELSPSIASTYIYLQPIIAAAIAIYLKKEELDWIKVTSAVLVIVGIYLVSLSRKQERNNIKALTKDEETR